MSDHNSLDGLMNEFMATLSQDTQEAMLRRVNAERMIRLYAEQIIDQHQAESIRILPDQRLAGEAVADFLVQIDDYDLRIVLLDSADGKPKLTTDQLEKWLDLLEDNPSTAIMIVVWTTNELLALPFSMIKIKTLMQFPEQIEDLLKEASPLELIIPEIILRQVKKWEIDEDLSRKPETRGRDIYSIFAEKIGQAIDDEANRRYRNVERLKAAQEFPYQKEKQNILTILSDALEGKSAKELEILLTRLPRRGSL